MWVGVRATSETTAFYEHVSAKDEMNRGLARTEKSGTLSGARMNMTENGGS
jgi:hypothetical protein